LPLCFFDAGGARAKTAPVIGEKVGLTLKDGQIIIKPKKAKAKYKLDDLLAQCDPNAKLSEEEQQWLNSSPIGRELI